MADEDWPIDPMVLLKNRIRQLKKLTRLEAPLPIIANAIMMVADATVLVKTRSLGMSCQESTDFLRSLKRQRYEESEEEKEWLEHHKEELSSLGEPLDD